MRRHVDTIFYIEIRQQNISGKEVHVEGSASLLNHQKHRTILSYQIDEKNLT